MNREHLTIKYGSLIHLSCDDGYISTAGLEGESLFIRDKTETGIDEEPLPLLGFETCVFRVELPAWMSAAKSQLLGECNSDNPLIMDHYSKINTAPDITFGQAFVLVHAVSQMHVAVFPSRPSKNDSDCVKLVLVRPGEVEAAFCEFVFLSRYKIHDDGDIVCRGDKVLLRLATYPIFMHVTASALKSIENPVLRNTCGELHSVNDFCVVNTINNSIRQRNDLTVACDEVNGSEEMSVTLVVERYDVGRDQANYQRALHRIAQPYVPSGVPVVFYHREHESFLSTSFTVAPRQQQKQQGELEQALGCFGGGEADSDDGDDIHGHFLVTRRCHSVADGIITSRGAMKVKDGDIAIHSTDHDSGDDETVIDDDGAPYPLFEKKDIFMGHALGEDRYVDNAQCSCTAMWILENEDPTVGGAVRMQSTRYRLRQVCSNLYLAVAGSGIDAFFDNDGPRELDDTLNYFSVDPLKRHSGSSSTDQNNVRATELCMIPPPRSQKDLQRTLFLVRPMFPSKCNFLIENECLLLQNVLTEMYVCAHEKRGRLFLQWQPSAHDAIIVWRAPSNIGHGALFLRTQCERLCRYRDAFQALALEKQEKPSEDMSEERQEKVKTQKPPPSEKRIIDSQRRYTKPSLFSFVPPGEYQTGTWRFSSERQTDTTGVSYASLLPTVRACQHILAELIRFCSASREWDVLRHEGIPILQNQRMMFDMNVQRLIIDIILAPFSKFRSDTTGTGDAEQMTGVSQWGHRQWGCDPQLPLLPLGGGVIDIDDVVEDMHVEVHLVCRLAFRLLRQMVRKAPLLKVGLDEFIPFFFELDGRGFCVVDTLTEILTDNPNISMPTLERVVDYFIDSLHHTRNASDLEPLASMCTIGLRGISERQALVCQRLLVENGDVLPHFGLDPHGDWAIVTARDALPVPYNVFFDLIKQKQGTSNELARFVQGLIDLLSRLCFDGCPSACYVEVAKVFPPNVLLRAIQTFVWTGNEVAGRHSSLDLLRGHILRFALWCYIMPCINNPAGKLRAVTVLFGSSLLRMTKDSKQSLSGNPDDEMIRKVKFATFNIIRANPHFVRSDTSRSVLLRASLDVWFHFVRAHQVTLDEVESLIPPLLNLLESGNDVINDKISRVAKHTQTRLEVSEASVQVMKTREKICMTLLQLLEGAVHRASDEIILLLHGAFVNNMWLPSFGHHKAETADTYSLRVHGGLGGTRPGEEQALLAGSAGPSRHGYQAVDTDSEAKDTNDGSVVLKAVMEHLRHVCEAIRRQFSVDETIPRLIDLTRYDRPQLRALAIELLVRFCTVKRGVAHRVLQVHTLPSAEVTQNFDNFYTIAVNIHALLQRGCLDEALTLALTSVETEPPHDVSAIFSKTHLGGREEGEEEEEDSTDDNYSDDGKGTKAESGPPEEGDSKTQRFWGKAIAAARMVNYAGVMRQQRGLVGPGETSETPLRFVIRMELVCHWRIHITLLGMYSSIDPGSLTFCKWMRFFYLFTLSRSNSKKLRRKIDLFLHSLTLNKECAAMCIHIILAILGTVSNPGPYLTTTFLKGCVEYLHSQMAQGHFDSNFLSQLGSSVFSKPAVGGVARRRMMQLLWDHDIFQCLPRPAATATSVGPKFIASLVEFLCCVCSSSTSALVIGQRALPMSNIFAIILEYGAQYSPLHVLPYRHGSLERNAFRLIGTYLRAVVSMYFTAFKEEDGQCKELHKMEWMANRELWSVLRLLTDQLHGLSKLITSEVGKVMNRGLFVLQRFRHVWLGSIPMALLAFFSECFSESGFYRYRHVMGSTFDAICESLICFSSDLLTFSKALALEDHEAVYYSRLLGLLHMHVVNIYGLESLAGDLDAARNKMVVWQLQCDQARRAEQQKDGGHGVGEMEMHNDDFNECEDIQESFLARRDVSQGLRDNLATSFYLGLSLSSVIAQRREVEVIRGTLSKFVRSDVLIPVEDSMDVREAASIVNALLRRSPKESSIRDFIGHVLDGIQKRYFSSMALVGLLNFFYNVLRTTIYEKDSEPHLGKGADACETKEDVGYALQLTFSDLGMSHVIASLCALDDDVLTYNTIRVGVMLLEGGNQRAQNAFLDYLGTHREGIFHKLRDVMQKSLQWVQQLNMCERLFIMERGVSLINIPNVQKFTSALFTNVFSSPLCTGVRKRSRTGRKQHLLGWDSVQGCLRLRLLCTLFRLLQLFCEGHNARMQNYLRCQHNNMHNVNILYEVMMLLGELSTIIHPVAFDALHGGFEFLTEVCQGPCHRNQETLLGYDVCTSICNLFDLMGRPEAIGMEVEQVAAEKKLPTNRINSRIACGNIANGGCGLLVYNRNLTNANISCLSLSLTTCLLSLIEGCHSPEFFCRVLAQIPIEIIERQFSVVTPEMCDRILEDEELEDDPGVASLFNWLIFLHSVRPFAKGEYLQRIDDLLDRASRLKSRLGFIQVQRADGLLENVFFRVPFICRGLTRRIKSSLLWDVNCTSRATKLSDFLHLSDNLIFEVERDHAFQRWVAQWTHFKLTATVSTTCACGEKKEEEQRKKRVSLYFAKKGWNQFVAPMFFSSQLSFYESFSVGLAVVINFGLVWVGEMSWDKDMLVLWNYFFMSLCALQLVVSLVAFCVDVIVFFPVCLYREYRRKQHRTSGFATPNVTMQEVFNGFSGREVVRIFCTQFHIQLRLFLIVMAVMSLVVSYYFAAAHLLLIIRRVPTPRTFITAITHNGKQLLLSAFLGLILLYFFAITGYFFFQREFDGREGSMKNKNCGSVFRCFVFILWYGLRQGGGVGDIMQGESWKNNSIFLRITYDMLFFVFINVIFLNVVFGLIIDTFGALRDGRHMKEVNMRNTCFVCGLGSGTFEKDHAGGFRAHVLQEHNLWMYLYFIHHLRRKNPNDFTGQESYVYEKIQQNDIGFFPEGNAFCVQESRRDRGAAGGECGGAAYDYEEEEEAVLLLKKDTSDITKGCGAGPESMTVTLKELAEAKRAFGVFLRDISINAQKLKSMVQQLEVPTCGASSVGGAQQGPSSFDDTFGGGKPLSLCSQTRRLGKGQE